jgi:hypothetical protein
LTFFSVGGIAAGGRSSTSISPVSASMRTRYLHESTYHLLIGLLGAKPSITASRYFADPVADITVLGAPDNQSLGDECGQYDAFVEALPPMTSPRGRPFLPSKSPSRRTCSRSTAPGPTSPPAIRAARFGSSPKLTVNGMSGSPLISTTGAAIGVASINNIAACLVNGLPGWLVRELR